MVLKTKKVTLYEDECFCDVCGDKQQRQNRCKCCAKHVCINCSVNDYTDSDDYPDKFCKSCWGAGKEFREEIEVEEENSYKKICKLKEEWYKQAKDCSPNIKTMEYEDE